MRQLLRSSGRWSLLLVVAAFALLYVAATQWRPADDPAPHELEGHLLELINVERRARDLPDLRRDPELTEIAREWTAEMVAAGEVIERDDLAEQVEWRVVEAWRRVGENVGRASGVEELHEAFMASPSHREALLDDFDRVGVGVVVDAGTTWATVELLLGPPEPTREPTQAQAGRTSPGSTSPIDPRSTAAASSS